MNEIIQLNSVDVYNKMYGLKTLHPLVSVVDLRESDPSCQSREDELWRICLVLEKTEQVYVEIWPTVL